MDERYIKLKRVNFTHAQFRSLNEHEQALLALFSLSISETCALRRIFVCCQHSSGSNPIIDLAIANQKHVILRTWSAKLVEFRKALKQILQGKKVPKELRDFVQKILSDKILCEEQGRDGLEVVFRNGVSNHMSIPTAKRNFAHLNEDADIGMYFHEGEANTLLPLGEEVFFAAMYNRFLANENKSGEEIEPFLEWNQWNIDATKRLTEFLDQFVTDFIYTKFPDLDWTSIELQVFPDEFGYLEDIKVPLFHEVKQ